MKRLVGFALLGLLCALPVIAAPNSQNMTLPAPVQVSSTTLPAGTYKVTWTGSGASAQVTLEKKGVPPVTMTAKIVEQKSNQTFVSTKTENGQQVLESISFRNLTLVF